MIRGMAMAGIALVILTLGGVANAQSATTQVGISGDKFTINGQPKFLLGASYYDPTGWRASDLDGLAARGFNLIRCFLHWDGWNRTSFNSDGTLRNTAILDLARACSARGIVVDVSILDSSVGSDQAGPMETAVRNAVRLLRNEPNVFFDVVNEHNGNWAASHSHSVMGSLLAAARQEDPNAILTFSSAEYFGNHLLNSDTAVRASGVNEELAAGVQLLAPHFHRHDGWYAVTDTRVATLRNYLASIGRPVPVYLQEESRRGGSNEGYEPTKQNFLQAAREARDAGAAGWVFHTDAGFDLGGSSWFSNLDSVERETVDALGAEVFGGGGGGGGSFTLTANPGTAAPGGTVAVSWTAPSGQTSSTDWVGLHAGTTPPTGPGAIWWQYTNGATSGSVNVTAPVTQGTYTFRYFLNDGYTAVASAPLTVSNGSSSPPVAPSGLSAVAVSSSQINLSWTDNALNETGFQVERGPSSAGPWSQIVTPGANVTSTSNTGLSPSMTYHYRVRAVNGTGASSTSNVANATTLSGPATSSVIAINSGGGASGLFVADTSFNGGSTFATGAAVATNGVTNPAPQAVYQSERWGNFTYAVPGFTPGATHTVRLHFAEIWFTSPGQRVFNVSINGSTVLSNFDIVAAAGGSGRAVVREFTATADGGGKITIAYTAGAANWPKSSGIEIIGGAPGTAPPAPSGLSAAAISSSQINLSWADNASNETGFQVERGPSSAGPWTQIATPGANATNHSNTGLSPSTTYHYRVRAVNGTGASSTSNVANATTLSGPGPSSVIAINSGGGASGLFVADTSFNGGSTFATGAAVATNGVTNPAPQAVYQSERWGNFTYAVSGLTAGATHTIRLHFAEIWFTSPAQRMFNVSINGSTVLSNFDIVAAAGGSWRAVVKEFSATADGGGKITIAYTAGAANWPKSSGIELIRQ